MGELSQITTNLGTQINVSEYKKNQIEEMISMASYCEQIDQIILFGSSLSSECREDSDIDVVIISRDSVSELSRNKRYRAYWDMIYKSDSFRTDYDILYFNSYEDIVRKKEQALVCREILEKGQIIYSRKGCA